MFNIAPYKVQRNVRNPMGYEGKFITAFGDLMEKVWDVDSWF